MKMVHASLGVHFRLEGARGVGQLGAREDVEVVVRSVAAGVSLGANSGAWDRLVFEILKMGGDSNQR